ARPRLFVPRPEHWVGAHPQYVRRKLSIMSNQRLLQEGLVQHVPVTGNQAESLARFSTILADPPWEVLQRGGRGAWRHYSLMSTEEIAALPVGRLARDDAHLWLWVTNATLFAGQMVMRAWGFTY